MKSLGVALSAFVVVLVTTPASQAETFSVKYDDKSNKTCILINIQAKFTFTYNTTDNKSKNEEAHLDKEGATGNCSLTADKQQIIFKVVGKKGKIGDLSWTFTRNTTTKMYSVDDMELTFKTLNASFPNIKDVNKDVKASNESKNYESKVDQGYRCTNQPGLSFKSNSSIIKVAMTTTTLQVQAFRSQKEQPDPKAFSGLQSCPADMTSNIVPIAVGAALAGLVVIVLIAYLIGRRRNKKGYESV